MTFPTVRHGSAQCVNAASSADRAVIRHLGLCSSHDGLRIPRGRESRWSDALQCTEVKCSRCGEFWPCDTEFYAANNGRPSGRCKACEAEVRVSRGTRKGYGRYPTHAEAA